MRHSESVSNRVPADREFHRSQPVHVIGLTTDSHTVVLTQIWVDGKKVTEINGNSINVSLPMTAGITHRATVQAVDNINQGSKQTVYVTAQ